METTYNTYAKTNSNEEAKSTQASEIELSNLLNGSESVTDTTEDKEITAEEATTESNEEAATESDGEVSTGGKIMRGVVSALCPGYGQFINGDIKKGALYIAGTTASILLAPFTGGLSLLGTAALAASSSADAVKNAE